MSKYAFKTTSETDQVIIDNVDLITEIEKKLPPPGYHRTPLAKQSIARSCSFYGREGKNNTQVIYGFGYKNSLWRDTTQDEINGKNAEALNVIDYIATRFCDDNYTEAYKYFYKEYPELNEKIKKVINQGQTINDDNEIEQSTLYDILKADNENLRANPEIITREVYQRGLGLTYEKRMKLGYYVDDNNTKWLTIPYYDALGNIIYCRKRNLSYYNTDGSENKQNKASRFMKDEDRTPLSSDTEPLWGLHTLCKKNKFVVISEGMFDSMLLDCNGYTVLSSGNCKVAGEKYEDLIEIIEYHKKFTDIVILLDNDKAGIDGAKQLAIDLLDHEAKKYSDKNYPNKTIRVVLIPEIVEKEVIEKNNTVKKVQVEIKDVADYYKHFGNDNDPNFADLILQNSFDALSFLAYLEFKNNSVNAISEVKSLVKRYNRWLPTEHFTRLIANLEYWQEIKKFHITKADIREIEQLTKPPTEDMLINEILSKYQLIFDVANGFYKFDKGYWRNVEDQEVRRNILELQGRFKRHTTKKAVFESVADITEEEAYHFKFDRKDKIIKDNIVTFNNGTLNLDTEEFFEHQFFPEHYLTFKLNFDYNPEADCPVYDKFIKEIMSEDQAKINLINEAGGYMFMKYTNLQRCFWFVGDGSNGKSTLFEVLKMVVGDNNWSGVLPSKMHDNFEVITMQDKLINIAPDINSNIADAIEILKPFIGDGTVRGCKKRKDVKDLNVFSKLFLGSNDMPIVYAHTDNSMERRIIFIKFNESFTDIEDPYRTKRDKDINVNLLYELIPEKSGIFNRFFEGYKRLKNNGKFTQPEESKILTNEFTKETNKALAYYDAMLSDEEAQKAIADMEIGDYIIPMDYYGTTKNGTLFVSRNGLNLVNNSNREHFREWCDLNGVEKVMAGNTFSKHFTNVFLQKHPEFKSDETTNKENRKAIVKVTELAD